MLFGPGWPKGRKRQEMEEDIDTEIYYKCVRKVFSRYTSMEKLNVLISNAMWNVSFWILS